MVKLSPEFSFHIQSDPHATDRLQKKEAFTELIAEHGKTLPGAHVRGHTRGTSAGASLPSGARRARTLPRAATDMKYSVGISGPRDAPAPRAGRTERTGTGRARLSRRQPPPARRAREPRSQRRPRSHLRPLPAPAAAPAPAARGRRRRRCAASGALPPPCGPAPPRSRQPAEAEAEPPPGGPWAAPSGAQRPRYCPLPLSLPLSSAPVPPAPSLTGRDGRARRRGPVLRRLPGRPGREGPVPASPAAQGREAAAVPGSPRWREGPRGARGRELMINPRAIECLPKVAPWVGFNLVRGSVPPVWLCPRPVLLLPPKRRGDAQLPVEKNLF